MTTEPLKIWVDQGSGPAVAIVPVALIIFDKVTEAYQVQVWTGPYDLSLRCWLGLPNGPRAQSRDLLMGIEAVYRFGEQMALDLGCVDLIAQHTN